MKTEFIIRLTIKHDTDKCKHVALNSFCKDLKEGMEITGVNGIGDKYQLEVTTIKERSIR